MALSQSQTDDASPLSREEALIYDWRIYSIRKALKQRGQETGVLHIQDFLELGHLDQYHYCGHEACDRAIERLAIDATAQVLDIGSGVGGPARYISHKTGCHVRGIELRQDFNQIAQELTARVGLDHNVQYLTGSILSTQILNQLPLASFDSILSFLCFLHIQERQSLLNLCFRYLKEEGQIYIEDYVANASLSPTLQSTLESVVQAAYVPTREIYREHFERAGFQDICFIDLTSKWTAWVQKRYQDFIQSQDESIRVFGQEVYDHRSQFYQTIHHLFQSRAIGGSIITARKPSQAKITQVPLSYGAWRTAVYSEQYHFFLDDGSLLALRYFKTDSLQHYSAWWCDAQGEARELINTVEERCSEPYIQMIKGDRTGKIRLLEPDLDIDFQIAAQCSWDVPGEKDSQAVIHQPQLLANIRIGQDTKTAVGYCKIYQGAYPKFWGYHFVHAFFPNYGIIWSADATFGQEKYNYFKLLDISPLADSSETLVDHGEESYHRQASAHATIQNRSYQLTFEQTPYGSWSSLLRNRPLSMESDLHLDYHRAILTVDGKQVSEGVCLKESCFGTIS